MAGRFTRTSSLKIDMPNLIPTNARNLLNNPYYLFNNASQSVCSYYNINTTMTTLDESTRGNYGEISSDSPIRFNKISNFCIYGINKIEPSLETSEYGLESSDITGDAIILPNTIIPYPGDFFSLNQIDKPYLFKITSVNPNTLDTGATMYRVNYTLSSSDGVENIEAQVVKKYNFYIENYGSNFGCLIEEATASEIAELERYTVVLKDYYLQLFYDYKIQSFSYLRDGVIKVYDPYLIEFIIRNKIMTGSTRYVHVDQQIFLPATFGVDYDRTIFSALEDRDPYKHYCKFTGNLLLCTQKLSLLYAYPQDYYIMDYSHLNTKFHIIDIFDDPGFMDRVHNKETTNNVLKNIVINYLNGSNTIDETVLSQLKQVDYMQTPELFYLIPLVIYCIEQVIINILSNGG